MTKKKTRTAKQAMNVHVRRLRAAGWRVHNGRWPRVEARWDFCRLGENTLCPLTPEARRATDALCAGEPIPAREQIA
jgi:hypothetical protein